LYHGTRLLSTTSCRIANIGKQQWKTTFETAMENKKTFADIQSVDRKKIRKRENVQGADQSPQ